MVILAIKACWLLLLLTRIIKKTHIHVFIKFKNPRSFMRIKKTFPMCHIDKCEGTDIQCIDYVFKEGEWSDNPKGETNLRDTHME